MRGLRMVSVGACVVVLGLAATALAGTVSVGSSSITYNADPAATEGERVDVGVEEGKSFIASERGVTGAGCTQTDPTRVDCPLTQAFVINLLGLNDSVGADKVTGSATLEVHGNGGDDQASGTANADKLFGDAGGDSLDGRGGNDTLDAGPGDDNLYDGPGDDVATGGPGNDNFIAGPGRDVMTGGDGVDVADYSQRSAPVSVTADGTADDGEAGEGDNVMPDVESVTGGSGNDRIVGGPAAAYLYGAAGNDTIIGGPSGSARVEGNEGDDIIDTRNGKYDSVDCGPGNDTLYGDLDDSATGCEIAPDRDGDGTLNEADCAPDNPAVHPGGSEIFGNDVDEDCKNGPGYFKVGAGFDARLAPSGGRVRFTTLRVTALRTGDRVEVRCSGRGCAFKKKTKTAGKASTINLVPLFKGRYLRAGAVVEIRVLRTKFVGKVLRFQVTKTGGVKKSSSCITVGATKPGFCPLEG